MKPFLYLAARAAPRAVLSPSGLLASPAGSQEEGKEGKDPAETSATVMGERAHPRDWVLCLGKKWKPQLAASNSAHRDCALTAGLHK